MLIWSTVGFAYVAFGGVHPGSRVVLHAGLAATLLVVVFLPSRTLARGGALLKIQGAGLAIVCAVLVGLVPLPNVVLSVLSPGVVDAKATNAWATLSLDTEATVEGLCHVLLVMGTAVGIAAWGLARWRRRDIEKAVLATMLAVLVLGALHAATSTTSLLGVVPTWIVPPSRFFAPFLNPNHFGGSLLLGLPILASMGLQSGAQRSTRIAGLVGTLWTLAMLAWAGSTGPIAVAALLLLAVAVVRGLLRWWTAALLGILGVALVGWQAEQATDVASLHGRLLVWAAALKTLPAYWFGGGGVGAFDVMVGPARTDHQYAQWVHAHNDWLEWVAGTGLVGLVAGVVALWLLRPGASRAPERSLLLALGVCGVLLHALVDFPLMIPAIAMSVAAVWAFRLVVYEPHQSCSPRVLRATVATVAVLQLLAAGWEARTAVVTPARELALASGSEADRGAKVLAEWAPWGWEQRIHDARLANRAGRHGEALEGARDVVRHWQQAADPLRYAAVVLVQLGADEDARGAAERSIQRAPWDWRGYAVKARIDEAGGRDGEAVQAWRDAMAHGAPVRVLKEGWHLLPVGLYWVEAVEGLSAFHNVALARFLVQVKDFDAALLAYEQARMLDPDWPLGGYPELLMRLGRLEEAQAFLDEQLAERPDDLALRAALGDLKERQGLNQEAVEIWLDLSKAHPRFLRRALVASRGAGGVDAALVLARRIQLERGTSLDPQFQLEYGRLLRDAGRGGDCVRVLVRSGLLDDGRYGVEARRLHDSCLALGN